MSINKIIDKIETLPPLICDKHHIPLNDCEQCMKDVLIVICECINLAVNDGMTKAEEPTVLH